MLKLVVKHFSIPVLFLPRACGIDVWEIILKDLSQIITFCSFCLCVPPGCLKPVPYFLVSF